MSNNYDRTVRTVMWMDAFLSVAMVIVCVVTAPLVALLGLPAGVQAFVGVSAIVCAVLLAAFGAVTAVLLMVRMRSGQYFLPNALRLPLPPGMRPELTTSAAATRTRASGSRR